jgi:predicted ATPase
VNFDAIMIEGIRVKQQTNWCVITGGPSSGKSTVIRHLKDMGYKTTIELARHYIDLQRMNGRSTEEVRSNQRQFQHKVLNLQILLERRLDPEELVFLDRGLPDELAYYEFYDMAPDEKLLEYLEFTSYKKIFIMDLLPLDKDYARTEDAAAQLELHRLIIETYRRRSEPIVMVPVSPPKERVQFVLDNL